MGHEYLNAEETVRLEQHKELERQLDRLKAAREKEGLTLQQQQELQAHYQEVWNEMLALIPKRCQDDCDFCPVKDHLIEKYDPDRQIVRPAAPMTGMDESEQLDLD